MSTERFSNWELVAYVIFLFGTIIATFRMPKYWRGELDALHDQGSTGWWPFGEPIRRGFLRSLHLGVAVGWIGSSALVFMYIEDVAKNPALRHLAHNGIFVCFGFFVLVLLLDLVITLFNRPKFLVPRSHRDAPGAIREWIEMFKQRKGQRGRDAEKRLGS